MTLVEVLIVLAILALSAGAVALAIGSDGGGTPARVEANRLADRLRLAADEALITGRPIQMSWSRHAYQFEGTNLADWAQRHTLPRGVTMEASQPVIVIDPDGAVDPVTLSVSSPQAGWRITFDGLNADVAPPAQS